MEFSRSVLTIIRERISVRKFDNRPLQDPDIAFLEALLEALPEAPYRSRSRFVLVAPDAGQKLGQLPGTYGIIRGAQMYLVGGAEDSFQALIDFGYQMEYIILQAWDRGLGTCWLGGTFQRSPVERYADFPQGYIIPAITPVGYSAEKEGFVDSVLHRIMGSRQRKPAQEIFFTDQWHTPLDLEPDDAVAIALEMVRLGPSAMNRQPWRVIVDGETTHFYIQKSGLSSRIYKGMFQPVDVGIACCHFDLAMQELNRAGKWLNSEKGRSLENASAAYCVSWQQMGGLRQEGDSSLE
jgi:nitroreductase